MPMAAQQVRMAEPLLDALAEPCLKSQEVAHGPTEPLTCKVEARAAPQRRQACGIFTPQLWKAVGLVPRQLDAMPEQCTPRGTDARAPLLPPSAGGTFGVGSGARRLQSGRTFSSDLSFGSASTAGCVSLRMASSDINPKSLKSAAIMAYEASAAEGSDASGALSDSTGVSPGQIAVGSGAAVTSGRPFLAGASGRQRSVGGHSASGSSLGREAGVAVLPSAAAAGLHASTLADAAHSQHTPSGVSFASSYGSSLLDGGAHPAVAALMGAPSLAARSDSGSADPAAVYTGELHECLLCRQHTCFPTGPATIRCSDCRGTMHRDCFIAHYQVVPGRRDWTYCPVHSQVQKNRLPAKPRTSGAAHRRGPQHHRKRPHPEDAPRGGDGAGDREFTAGPGFERVPSGSRSQRRRGNASGGSAALAAAGMGPAGGDSPAADGIEARSAAASPASLHGGDGGDAAIANAPSSEAAGTDGAPPRCFVSSRGRESRPVRRQYDSDDAGGADAATPRAGKRGPLDPSPLSTGGGGGTVDKSPMELDAPGGPLGSAPSSPLGVKSESGSAAEPDSPTVGGPAPRAGPGKLRAGGLDADSSAGPAAAAASRSRAAAGGGSRAQDDSEQPSSPRGVRPPQPTSPRSTGGSRKALRSTDGSKGREQRPAPASPRAGGRPRAPPAAAPPSSDAAAAKSPPSPAAKTPAELNDEELAMLLHQELNAPSRRRGQRMPGAV